MKTELSNGQIIYDYKGDEIGKTGFINNKYFAKIFDKLIEIPIQCSVSGNLEEKRLYLTRSNPKTKPYQLKFDLQIINPNGEIILNFDLGSPKMVSIVPSTSIAFSPLGNVLFLGLKKDEEENYMEKVKILNKNGESVFYKEYLTKQNQYFYPKVAINKNSEFLICNTQEHIGFNPREWNFKYFNQKGTIEWEFKYSGMYIRDVAINQKGDLFFIDDNENFKTDEQELIIVEEKGRRIKKKSLDRIFTNIYHKEKGIINLNRLLYGQERYNHEMQLNKNKN